MSQNTFNKRYIPTITAAILLTFLFMSNSVTAMNSIREGIDRCMTTLIPSLFPFMVLSSFFIECDALSLFGRLFGKRFQMLFGVSNKALAAVFAGLLFGFPIGTLSLIALCDRKEITQNELYRSMGICGIPSFGFTVNTVGISLFSDRAFGIFLYFSSFAAAVICGIVSGNEKKDSYIISISPAKNKKASEMITNAIISSAKAVFTLCAYVVFFSCVSKCLITEVNGAPEISALLGSVLELTCGAFSSSPVDGVWGYILCGFTIGWSGLSVHLQTATLLQNRTERLSLYFLQKALQGLLCAFAAFLFFILQ